MPHIHELIDYTATVYVVNGDRVLLRKHDKYKFWCGPGGHIELDENPNQAAVREVKEETGLDVRLLGEIPVLKDSYGIENLLPPAFMNIHQVNETHRHLDLIYFAVSDTQNVSQGEGEVSEEMRWLTKEELNDPSLDLFETVHTYALAALEAAKK